MNTKIAIASGTSTALAAYSPNEYNVLTMPRLAADQRDWQLTITIVTIDATDPELVYSTPGRQGHVSLHALALQHIALAAGISFDRTAVAFDPAGSPVATVTASMTIAPGQRIAATGTYRLDLPARLDELRLAAEAQPDAQKRAKALAELPGLAARTKRFAVQLAETGARNRALRVLLGVRSSYTKAALARPFIVPRLHFNPQTPLMKAAMATYIRHEMAALSGEHVDDGEQGYIEARAALDTAGAVEAPPTVSRQETEITLDDPGEHFDNDD